jgi:hypothetical protein
VRSLLPFGLSITLPAGSDANSTATVLVHDLFLPTDETFNGQPVMRGIDTNHSIFACSDTWVISSSRERSSWARCEGDVLIDRLSGKALLAAAAGGSRSPPVPTVEVHSGFSAACGSLLRSTAVPAVNGGMLAFPKTISANEVACWLARLFGPQSTIPSTQAPIGIDLPEGVGSVPLLTDLVLPRGRSLTVRGGGNTILVGSRQLRVEADAVLTLEFVTIANSVRSTAIAIEGGLLKLSNGTLRNCNAYKNTVNAEGWLESRGGAISVNAAGRLELVSVELYENNASEGEATSSGGAIYCTEGSISITQCRLHKNIAHRAGLSNRDLYGIAQGGAIFLKKSSLAIDDSELFQNVATDGGWMSQGGAVYGIGSSLLTMRRSKLYENLVDNGGLLFTAADKKDAGSYGGAVYLEQDCVVKVIECEMCDNMARAGAQWTEVGAIGVYAGSSLLVLRSKLLRNAVLGDGNAAAGGAAYLIGGDKPSIGWFNQSEISDNRATSMNGGSDCRDCKPQAGAVFVLQAQLTVVDCKLQRNFASGGDTAFGGAFAFASGSRVLVQRSNLSGNVANGGDVFSQGGGIWADIGDTGELQIESTELSQNHANSSAAASAAGGALYLKSGSVTLIDSNLIANLVAGRTAYGGAVYSSGTILTIRTMVSMNRAFSNGASGEAFGGGLFNSGAMMWLVDSRLLENVASIASPAIKASAGAMYNARGAQAKLDGCLLRSNAAGGLGYLQATNWTYDEAKRTQYEASTAAHIFTSGGAEITHSKIADASHVVPIGYSAQRWIVVDGGTLYAYSSNFSAAKAEEAYGSDALLWLLNVAPDAEILIRQCAVRNLKLQSAANSQKVGVVNSEFEPPLNTSVFQTLQPKPGECSSVVVNEQMCDPRAICKLQQSGGVHCACVGENVHEKSGSLTSGQQCEQGTTVSMLLQSRAVSITMLKPSNGSAAVQIVVNAGGESRTVALYSASMVRRSAMPSVGAAPNSSRVWSRLDEAQLSLDGHHVVWSTVPPADDSEIELDGGAKRYTITKEYAFQLAVDCHGEGACVADGDTVETVVEVGSESGGGASRSQVHITTLIQALASCHHSVAAVMQSGGSSQTAGHVTDPRLTTVSGNRAAVEHNTDSLALLMFVYDVDGLPIEHSVPDLTVLWGPASGKRDRVLYQRSDLGAHVFAASVPQEWRSHPGPYLLSAYINQGWDNKAIDRSDCIIAEFPISIRCSEGYVEADPSRQCTQVLNTRAPIVEIVCSILAIVALLLVGLRCWYLRSDTTAARRLADKRARTLERLRARWASKGNLGPLNKRSRYGDLPIHCVAAGCPPLGLLKQLLQGFPEGASSTDHAGNLPLHLMVLNLGVSKQPVGSVYPAFEALLAAYPKAAITPGKHSKKLPVELLLDMAYSPPEKARLEVLLGFPYSVAGLADNWLGLLQHPTENDGGEDAVEAMIHEAKHKRGVTIQQLAYATDSRGREAHAVATTRKRRCLWRHLLVLGRSASRLLCNHAVIAGVSLASFASAGTVFFALCTRAGLRGSFLH